MAKIVFVQNETRDRLGIMYLSAVLKKNGHKAEVFCNPSVKEVLDEKPDYLGLSCSSSEHQPLIKFAREVKKVKDIKVILGGVHATMYPEVIYEDGIDIICQGEGESALAELLNREYINDIRNLWVKEGFVIHRNPLRPLVGLDSLPIPDRSIYYNKYKELKDNPTKTFMFTRGCPYACSYCFNHRMAQLYQGKGTWVRRRSVEHALAEILYVRLLYGFKWVQINDDTINADKTWLFDFLDGYKRMVKTPFICNIRADTCDEETISRLKDAGCDRINMGVEQGDETLRKEVLRRNISNEKLIEVGRLINKYKIRLFTANMIGFPQETTDLALKTVKLNQQFRVEFPSCSVLQPYPGTDIFNYLVVKNLISPELKPDELLSPHSLFTNSCKRVGSVIKQDNIQELVNMGSLFYYFVKLPHLTWLLRLFCKLPPNKFFAFLWQVPILLIKVKYSNDKWKLLSQIWRPLK